MAGLFDVIWDEFEDQIDIIDFPHIEDKIDFISDVLKKLWNEDKKKDIPLDLQIHQRCKKEETKYVVRRKIISDIDTFNKNGYFKERPDWIDILSEKLTHNQTSYALGRGTELIAFFYAMENNMFIIDENRADHMAMLRDMENIGLIE